MPGIGPSNLKSKPAPPMITDASGNHHAKPEAEPQASTAQGTGQATRPIPIPIGGTRPGPDALISNHIQNVAPIHTFTPSRSWGLEDASPHPESPGTAGSLTRDPTPEPVPRNGKQVRFTEGHETLEAPAYDRSMRGPREWRQTEDLVARMRKKVGQDIVGAPHLSDAQKKQMLGMFVENTRSDPAYKHVLYDMSVELAKLKNVRPELVDDAWLNVGMPPRP